MILPFLGFFRVSHGWSAIVFLLLLFVCFHSFEVRHFRNDLKHLNACCGSCVPPGGAVSPFHSLRLKQLPDASDECCCYGTEGCHRRSAANLGFIVMFMLYATVTWKNAYITKKKWCEAVCLPRRQRKVGFNSPWSRCQLCKGSLGENASHLHNVSLICERDGSTP